MFAGEITIQLQLILQVTKNLDIDPVFIIIFDWLGVTLKNIARILRQKDIIFYVNKFYRGLIHGGG